MSAASSLRLLKENSSKKGEFGWRERLRDRSLLISFFSPILDILRFSSGLRSLEDIILKKIS